jgi:hypothetical protein
VNHRLTSSLAVYQPASGNVGSVPTECRTDDPSEQHTALTLINRGNWASSMGQSAPGGKLLLYAEEFTFLLEQGGLEVLYEDLPLSIVEAYAVLHQTGIPNALQHPASAYQVYSSLRTNGFVVMRPAQYYRAHGRAREKEKLAGGESLPAEPSSLPEIGSESPVTAEDAEMDARNPRKRKAFASLGEDEHEEQSAGQSATAMGPPATRASHRPRSVYASIHIPRPTPKRHNFGAAHMQPALPNKVKEMSMEQQMKRLTEMQGVLQTFKFGFLEREPDRAASSVQSESSSLSESLYSLLCTPCDYWFCWLPVGSSAAAGLISQAETGAFRKAQPAPPDFICAVTQ